uniref:Uncharacterized protein n=1 Tax=Tetranychus urticae TaxID=32264 RepID=T1KJM5_TETUR
MKTDKDEYSHTHVIMEDLKTVYCALNKSLIRKCSLSVYAVIVQSPN